LIDLGQVLVQTERGSQTALGNLAECHALIATELTQKRAGLRVHRIQTAGHHCLLAGDGHPGKTIIGRPNLLRPLQLP